MDNHENYNNGVNLAKEFVKLMETQRNVHFDKTEVPVPSKWKAWKSLGWGCIEFVGRLLVAPILFFAVYVIAAGSYGGNFLNAFPASFTFVIWSIVSDSFKEPLFELKRAYGFHKEPVYKWIAKSKTTGNRVIRTQEEIFEEIAKRIK